MTGDTHFQRLIPESGEASNNPKAVKRLIFCTGRVFYDLKAQLEHMPEKKDKIAIARIEQASVLWKNWLIWK